MALEVFVVRRGVTPASYLGRVVEIPAPPRAEDVAARKLDPAAPGFDEDVLGPALAGIGRPERLVPYGLVEPTSWERRFVAFAAARLGVAPDAGWDTFPLQTGGAFDDLARAVADPLAPSPQARDAVALFEADDPELEAIAAARALRTWLDPVPEERWAERLRDVLVLLPTSPGRRATWKRVLEAHGLAADAPVWRPIADLPVGQWLIALAGLAGWGSTPVHRDGLRDALLAPMYTLPVGARRSDLRACLRSVRAHRLDLEGWRAHLGAWTAAAEASLNDDLTKAERAQAVASVRARAEGLRALTDLVAKHLAAAAAGLPGVLAAADALGARARLQASGVELASAAYERAYRILRALAADDTADPERSPGRAVEEALRGALVRVEGRPRSGVRLLSYPQYDGRPARVVVLAGLEEGGYPSALPRLDPAEAKLATELGLESQDDELQRAARVAGSAAARASERVVLSFSRTDEAGADTFPGALLAAVRRRMEGGPGIGASPATEAMVRPASVADVASPADLLVATDSLVEPAVAGTALAERWARAASAARHLGEVENQRNPAGPIPAGPYTGAIGTPLGAKAYSPSALEKLGHCGFRYFVERILGAEEATDAGVDLDALETGSLLHLALARAAQDAIARRGAWELNAPEDEREKHVERVHGEVCGAIDAATDELLRAHPTLSPALVGHFLGRWKRTLRAWLEDEAAAAGGGQFGPGGAPEPEDLDDEALEALAATSGAAANVVERWRKVERAITLTEGARKKGADESTAADCWKKADTGRLVIKGDFLAAATEKDANERGRLLDDLRAALDEERAQRRQTLRDQLYTAYGIDRAAVPRRAVASEWSFGDEPEPSMDPKSTEKPLEIALPGGATMAVRGRVDRVDLAEDRPDAAIVDYKTGRAKGGARLVAEIGEGLHLQLPLYARAVDALLAGKKGIPAKARTVLGRLDFVRFRSPAKAMLEAGSAPGLVAAGPDGAPLAGGPPLPPQEVVAEHLGHALRRLEAGVLPPTPRNCPQTGGIPCPAQSVCGALEASLERILPPEPQPRFVPPPTAPREKKEKPTERVKYAEARPAPEPPPSKAALAAHEAGRMRACEVAHDVVVSAGAGSGKTTALVDRYVAALRAGARPSEILCITFTRKATAEMRSRVRDRIVDLDRSKVSPEELSRWVAELGTAPIRTIDAFAGEIATELSDEPVEGSDAARAFADEFVAERLAAEAEKPGAALKRLLERLPLAKVKLALATLLEQDALSEPPIETLDVDGIIAAWEGEAKRLAGDLPDKVKKLQAKVEKAFTSARSRTKTFERLRDGLDAAAAAFEKHGVLAGTWAAANLSCGRANDIAELVPLARPLRDRARALWVKKANTLGGCATAADVVKQVKGEAQLAHAALSTARGWLEPYREAKASRGISSFSDVIAAAERAVKAAAPALVQSRFPFRHVLVDEFQDTNSTHFRFIDAVLDRIGAAPGARRPVLFTVGDPKQSIYRFRGAEVDLFERHVAGADAAARASLSVCWRSAPELTRAISRLFGRVFDAELDPEAAVPWEPLAPKGDEDRGPRVELLRRDDLGYAGDGADAAEPTGEEPDEEVGAAPLAGVGEESADSEGEEHEDVERPLVRRIRELLREVRPPPGESPVALLTHSWDRALHYGKLLQEHGIPCFVQGGRGLLATREIVDLLHWLRALERQDDDLCFVGILRGGTLGVSDPGLYCLRRGLGLALRRIGADGFAAPEGRVDLSRLRFGFTFDAEGAVTALAPTGERAVAVRAAVRADAARLAVFLAAWQRADRQFGVVPPGAVLRGIVEDSGYEAVLHARPGGLQALANLRSFLDLVDAVSEGRSPMAAVRELDRIAEAGDDPGASGFTLVPGAAVTITVVHQAKGREWDVVVVPDLHRVKVRDRVDQFDLQRIVERTEKKTTEAWVPSAIWENEADLFGVVGGVGRQVLVRALAGAERAESRRLLYVACTRARERLVLGARWPRASELRAMAPHDPIDLQGAQSWLDVVQIALQLVPGEGEALVPGDGLWVERRDHAWVTPAGEGYGEPVPPPAPATAPAMDALRRATRAVAPVPLEIVNPSALTSDRPPPQPAIAGPAQPTALGTDRPFSSKDEEGNAFHRAAQLWSFRGAWPAAMGEDAVRDVLGPARLAARASRVDAIVRSLAIAQPSLVAELRGAADRGDVFSEVDVGFLDAAGRRFEGAIDLLYRDAQGRWHLLDYKTSDVARSGVLGERIAEYHPQVAAYAEALRGKLPGGASLSSWGLWFVEEGTVVRWSA